MVGLELSCFMILSFGRSSASSDRFFDLAGVFVFLLGADLGVVDPFFFDFGVFFDALELVESVENALDRRGDFLTALPKESPEAARRRRVGVPGVSLLAVAADATDASVPTEEARVRRFFEDSGIAAESPDSVFLGLFDFRLVLAGMVGLSLRLLEQTASYVLVGKTSDNIGLDSSSGREVGG